MTVHVWIPDATSPEHRSLLTAGVVVYDLPAEGRYLIGSARASS